MLREASPERPSRARPLEALHDCAGRALLLTKHDKICGRGAWTSELSSHPKGEKGEAIFLVDINKENLN